jgi:hypothetical protein
VTALIFIATMWVLPIFVGKSIGDRKGRAGWAWGLLLGWLGVIIVACLSDKRSDAHQLQPGHPVSLPQPQSGKTCPDCAETVQPAARVCRFCGHRFEGSEVPA